MINQQLLDYIKQQSQQGVSNEQIKQSLLSNGWQETDIDETFNKLTKTSIQPKKRKWKKIIFIIIATIVILILVILSIPKILGLFGKDIEPIDDSDLQIYKVSVADDENAFFDLMKIRDVIYEPTDKSQIIYDMYNGKTKTWDEQVAEEIVLKNSQAFAYFTEAGSKPKYQHPVLADPTSITLAKANEYESMFYLGSTQRMSRLSIIKALYLAKQGKDKEALEVALNPVRIGQKIQDSRLSLFEYLVSISIKKYGLETVQKIIPSLKLSNTELKQYIEELDEFYENEEGLVEAFKSIYFGQSLGIDSIVSGDLEEGLDFIYDVLQDSKVELNSFNFQPNKTKALFAEDVRESIKSVNQICGEITEPETKSLAPKNFIQFHTEENAIGKLIYDITQSGFIDVTRHKCQEDLLVGVTQAMIAIKAFKNDTNNYPESLNDLVPDYLSSVPQDPFDGKSLKYSKTKKILYSVGMDVEDLEGITKNKWKNMANPTFKINF
jgi:hypothetical protein